MFEMQPQFELQGLFFYKNYRVESYKGVYSIEVVIGQLIVILYVLVAYSIEIVIGAIDCCTLFMLI